MKLPSITLAVRDARRTFIRFPLLIIDAVIGTIALLVVIDHEGPPSPTFLFRVVSAAVLGFPLLMCLVMTAEKKRWGTSVSAAAQIAGLLLVGLYSLTVPMDLLNAPATHMIRLAMITTGLVLAALVVPYLWRESVDGFWHYCETIFLKLLVAFLYGAVLWVGLAIALAALDNLFGIEIPGKRYGELWVTLQGMFTPWFFLAGIPESLDELDTQTDYPKGLKVLSQYILVPLVVTYLVILYAYLGKIILAWDWPQGWVSKLILGFVGTGLFSLMFLHPISGRAENAWMKTASRWFFFVVLPLIVMLFLAVSRRVSEYGFTEGRYLAIALGIWLCIIVPYFILSRAKDIRIIPASLCLASFLVTFGPWSAFAVSERSQTARLQNLLTRNNILVNGSVNSRHNTTTFEDTKQISSILAYLHDMYGFDRIQPWFTESLRKDSVGSGSSYLDPSEIAKRMGIEYVAVWRVAGGGFMIFIADRGRPTSISGFDEMWRAQHLAFEERKDASNGVVRYRLEPGENSITVYNLSGEKSSDSLVIDFAPAIDRLVKEYGNGITDRVSPEKMYISASNEHMKIRINLTNVRVQRRAEGLKPITCDGDILYTIVR